MTRYFLLCLLLSPGLPLPALAQNPGSDSERPAMSCVPMDDDSPRRQLERNASSPIDIFAEHFEAPPGQLIRVYEDVRVEQGDQRLETGELIYNRETGRIDLPGWLNYSDALIDLEAGSGWLVTAANQGRFEEVRYRFQRGEGSGSAGTVELVSESRAQVEGFDFTTCDPDDPDWQLKASSVELDMESGRGVARNARLDFKGVPILWSPWLSFPLDDRRKTGFLYPLMGFSSDDGFDLSVPWYWNIAPNQDATLTPRWIQERGVMLGAEYRFMTPRQRGQLDLEVLPDDKDFGDTRYFGQFGYSASLAPRWRFDADLRRASDENYFLDLGGDLADSSLQFLRSVAAVSGRGQAWTLSLSADSFQVLDDSVSEASEPYRRLPRMEFRLDQALGQRLDLQLDSELVYFDRDEGVTGARLDLYPRLRYNLLAPGWFLRPTVGFRSTAYQLNGTDGDDSLSRSLPIASLDGGLIFERRLSSGRTQTLEPRLFYLYVPYRDQTDLPDFDTRELTFGFSQLFSDNRFSGPDRHGDANQLTAALTSRLMEADSGRSVLDFSIGQIFYFRDLRVGLEEEILDDRNRSASVAEFNWRPAQAIIASAGLQWDHENDETQVAQFGLSYQGQRGGRAALGYRFRRDRVDQVDLRLRWPVRENLALIGRANYSFEDDEPLELLAGVEYESCCWAVRLIGREYVRDRDADRRSAVFLELHLKGLGSLGRRPYPLFADHAY
ncbi:LPS-assembly protein LptD [Wenzhouxiangella marina]|uniref:LPS-assembly protein LptD n=1 Tax=Wenzhouxiangella marina TaxID=1579979 RepID=A0A0K0XZ45_9GAMM|nr:LPS assembly protein LptD [Wenzhouxiangella marina]AKS42945.1 organic solvent tolerance protein [Wenzhouxiangella marina]MBB6087371.1 LPS-assembly protein [Wenzhouxiangella marina]